MDQVIKKLYKDVSSAVMTDGYKSTHPLFVRPIDAMYSYIESRIPDLEQITFGSRYIISRFIGDLISRSDVDEAERIFLELNGFYDRQPWDKFVANGGRLPIRIRTVREGELIPTQNALATYQSLDKDAPLLPSWLEVLNMRSWYGNAVATGAFQNRVIIERAVRRTCDGTDAELRQIAKFMLHDFGARSVTCSEQAMIGGAAHLTAFEGSDNPEGILFAKRIYGAKGKIASTVPASEHMGVNSWGMTIEDEFKAHDYAYDQFGSITSPNRVPFYSDVIDSNDMFFMFREKFCRDILRRKDRFAKIVIRLDSGNPVTVVSKILDIFEEENMPFETNSKGFKVINYMGLLSSDGVWTKENKIILDMLENRGYAVSLIIFGVGGRALQAVTRDMYSVAIKGSSVLWGNEWHDIFKNPKTDSGKRSKRGLLDTVFRDGRIQTVVTHQISEPDSIMFTAYDKDGLHYQTDVDEFALIRQRVDRAVDGILSLPDDIVLGKISQWIEFQNAQKGIPVDPEVMKRASLSIR